VLQRPTEGVEVADCIVACVDRPTRRTNTRFLAMRPSTTIIADRRELVYRRRHCCCIMKCAAMEYSMA
jgi:hypothetical protein